MSFPRYTEYKDSGVEWLGEVPAHWASVRLKNAATLNMGQSPSSDDCNDNGDGLPFLQGNADFGSISPAPRSYCPVANKIANEGDILFSVRAPVGAINVADQRYGIGRGLCAITVLGDQCQGFLFHSLQLMKGELLSVATGSTYEAVSTEQVANARYVVPPLNEQVVIAAFLDRETAKIDGLVAEQEKLIALLKEKRQAVISHAVTKGLNPDAPMRDSGIEWLGEVPAHWKVVRIKHIKSSQENAFVDGPFGSNLKSEHFVEGGDVYVIESNFATQNKIDSSELKTITFAHFQTISRSEVREGDIVIAKIGAQFGKASILPALDKRSVVSGNSLKLTVNKALCATEWAHFQLIYLKQIGEIDQLNNGSAQPALSLGGMNNLVFLLPPVEEATEVANILNGQIKKTELLVLEAEHAISLLKERRSALISAAVTGKIDVRGWVAAAEAA